MAFLWGGPPPLVGGESSGDEAAGSFVGEEKAGLSGGNDCPEAICISSPDCCNSAYLRFAYVTGEINHRTTVLGMKWNHAHLFLIGFPLFLHR